MAGALTATVISAAEVLGVTGVADLITAWYCERSRVTCSSIRRSAGLPPLGSPAGRPRALLGGLFVGRPPARGSGGVEQPALEVVAILKVVVVEVSALRVVEAKVIMVAVVWALGVVAAAVAAGVQAHGVAVITGIAGVVVVAQVFGVVGVEVLDTVVVGG